MSQSTLKEDNHIFLERDLMVACWSASREASSLVALDLGDLDDFASKAALQAVRGILGRGSEVSLPVMRQEMLNQNNLAAYTTLSAHMADSDADSYGPATIRSLIQQVQHEACLRRCRAALKEIEKMLATASKSTPQEIQSEISQRLSSAFSNSTGSAIFLKDALTALADKMVNRQFAKMDGEIVVEKMSTGLAPIDEASRGGVGRGQTIILAGRPGTGKSSLARQFSMEWASIGAVYYWSGEMSCMEIAEAIAISRLKQSLEAIQAVPIYNLAEKDCPQIAIDDKSVRNVAQLVARVRFFALRYKLRALVVDYFGLACREKDPTLIGLQLKDLVTLAKDLDIPVLVLVQMNRDEKSRNDKRPVLTDLRGSGDIEQDAHVVWMIHSPFSYDKDEPEDYVQLWQRKHRTGPKDVCIELSWNGNFTTFGPWKRDVPSLTQSVFGFKDSVPMQEIDDAIEGMF